MSIPKISALAITLNEEENIETYLERLSFADEIIIVDSFSTDRTAELASKFPKTRVVKRVFDNFSAQKNYAISLAKNDWVTFFDLDEEVTESLKEEIIKTVSAPDKIAYFVKREYHFMGRKIRYSGFQTDYVIRLFNKNYCKYNSNLVHELIVPDGPTGKLKNTSPHYTYKSLDHYTSKLHQYSELQAKMLFEKGKKPTLYHFLFRPFYRFWHQYLIRLGILDGKEGFVLAYISAFAVFKRYVNLWQLRSNA